MPYCIPDWIDRIQAERNRSKLIGMLGKDLGASSGCATNSNGIVPCNPEEMRARTEAHIKKLGLYPKNKTLSLDAYSLARNIGSEVGSGTSIEKVIVAQAALNRLKLGDKQNISQLVMKDSRYYGKQSGSNPSVASSKNPSWDEIVIAEMALEGTFNNFGNGVTHYFNPRIMDRWAAAGKGKNAQQTYETWSHGWGSDRHGWMWIGSIPGIDTREHMLMKRVPKGSREWQIAYPQGLLAMRVGTPEAATALPCSTSLVPTSKFKQGLPYIVLGSGAALGLWIMLALHKSANE